MGTRIRLRASLGTAMPIALDTNVLLALMTLNRDDFARLFPALPLIVPNLNPQSPGAATNAD